MELIESYRLIEKNLAPLNSSLGFKKANSSDANVLLFENDRGRYKIIYNPNNSVISLEAVQGESDFEVVSRSLFEIPDVDERDCKSLSNEVAEEVEKLFKKSAPVDLSKVKMPKSVSRSKAKKGVISYDVDSLANRFGVLYPDLKDDIKKNIVKYGEFLPETFFTEIGNKRIFDVIKNGTEAEQKKLFKALCEIYEDGTNEVQDIIGVTILGQIKNDQSMMAVADKYMTDYMAGPVHEINKITAKNGSLVKKLNNPPKYKPKKRRKSFIGSNLSEG